MKYRYNLNATFTMTEIKRYFPTTASENSHWSAPILKDLQLIAPLNPRPLPFTKENSRRAHLQLLAIFNWT